MERIVNPTSDIFVRYLLGMEENKDILLDFINTILLDSGFAKAVEITILNPFNLKSFMEEKESILDVKAEDESRRVFDVEIQVIGNSSYVKRSLYYWAKNYYGQLKEGAQYTQLNPVICINILDFILFKDLDRAHSCFLPTEKDDVEYVLTDDFQIHFLELPKVEVENRTSFHDRLEKWAFFFKKEGLLREEDEMHILIKNDSVMERAHDTYRKFSANDEMLQMYEAREKRLKDEATGIAVARAEGLQEGAAVKARETACALKKSGVAVKIISKSTGLSKKEIEAL